VRIAGSLILGAILLGTFLYWEHRSDHPMMPLSFFKIPAFSAGSYSAFSVSMGMFGVSVMRLSGRTLPIEEADAIAHDVLETIITGLRAGVDLQAADTSCEVEPEEVRASPPGLRSR
jgi:hypothetical protein